MGNIDDGADDRLGAIDGPGSCRKLGGKVVCRVMVAVKMPDGDERRAGSATCSTSLSAPAFIIIEHMTQRSKSHRDDVTQGGDTMVLPLFAFQQ